MESYLPNTNLSGSTNFTLTVLPFCMPAVHGSWSFISIITLTASWSQQCPYVNRGISGG
jgi:hypothetical protein